MTSLNANIGGKNVRISKILISLVLLAQTGCYSFGAYSMPYDLAQYNREYVDAEKKMLLWNIGLLRNDQPPHFMMLSSITQQRAFTSGGSFQWTNMWNSLLIPFVRLGAVNNGAVTSKGADTYAVGPFTAGTSETPLLVFTPIQGQDFANHFESSLTDKFTYFLEDDRWAGTQSERAEIVKLFADGLFLQHGDGEFGRCPEGIYKNKRPSTVLNPHEIDHNYQALSDCVDFITARKTLGYTQIDGIAHQVPTLTSTTPDATAVVGALKEGYEWFSNGDASVLGNPVKMPAWFDYDPQFVREPRKIKEPSDPIEVEHPFWVENGSLKWPGLAYTLPPKYQWWERKDGTYVLLPDGYSVKTEKGVLLLQKDKNYKAPHDQPSYSNEIVRAVWPVQQDYFYVELRQQPTNLAKDKWFTDDQVKQACVVQGPTSKHETPDSSTMHSRYTMPESSDGYSLEPVDLMIPETRDNSGGSSSSDPTVASVICGYIKVGHLLQIFQRLGHMACAEKNAPDSKDASKDCSESIFGVGPKAPDWADNSTSYTYLQNGKETTGAVWVPAHNPTTQSELAERDRRMFLTVYKLYQMSLVDTAKLVTGAPAVTVGK